MVEFYCVIFQEYRDQNNFEELEMDTDSLYVALAEKKTFLIALSKIWSRSGHFSEEETAPMKSRMTAGEFSPRNCYSTQAHLDKRESGMFKEEFGATEMICLCSKT